MGSWWSWALTLIGVTGFHLAGRKVWWAWYINIANQALWAAYALVTRQWGFLLGIPIYLAVFIPNAVRWTRERNAVPDDPMARVEALCQEWDALTKGESPTTRAIRAAVAGPGAS